MEILKIGNIEIKPCPYAKDRYDIFEVRTGEKIAKAYRKDISYGISLERAITVALEVNAFEAEQTKNLMDFLNQYTQLKKETLLEIKQLLKK